MSLLAGLSQQGDSIDAHNSDPAAHGQTEVGRSVVTAPTTQAARIALCVPSCAPEMTLASFTYTASNTGTGGASYTAPQLYANSGATAGSRGAVRNTANSIAIVGAPNAQTWPSNVAHVVSFNFSRATLTTNGSFRIQFGRTNTAGEPTGSCFGLRITNTGSAMRVAGIVRNGSTETTGVLGDVPLASTIHNMRILVVGDGTVVFSLNGGSVTVAGAPASAFGGQYFWVEAENGADASDNWIGVFGLSILPA